MIGIVDGVAWYVAGFKADPADERVPAWKRTLGYRLADDEVLAPAVLAGPEPVVLYVAIIGNAAAAIMDGHLYVSTHWMAETWPDVAGTCARMEAAIRDQLAREVESN